jgi:hypothetical protein
MSCQADVSNVTGVCSPEALLSPAAAAAAAFDATKYCCRQPWHDIHAKVEGPAAMDICLNCELAQAQCFTGSFPITIAPDAHAALQITSSSITTHSVAVGTGSAITARRRQPAHHVARVSAMTLCLSPAAAAAAAGLWLACCSHGWPAAVMWLACAKQAGANTWIPLLSKPEGLLVLLLPSLPSAVMERWAKQAGTANVPKMRHLDDHKDIHLPAGFEVFTVRRHSCRRMQAQLQASAAAGHIWAEHASHRHRCI